MINQYKKIDIKAIRKALKRLGLKHILIEFSMISKYEMKYYKYFKEDERKLMRKFRELKGCSKDFAEWEQRCIHFDSFSFLNMNKQKQEIIKLLFGNERSWNYHVFWLLARFYIY